MRGGRAAIVAVALLAGACSSDSEPAVLLDGSPRTPDDQGVATALTHESITLDGRRTYDVSEDLVSFSTYDRKIEPMLTREGQYVHIGVDDGEMVWMAGIASVVRTASGDAVFYTGRLRSATDTRATFVDGTVFEVADGVEFPEDARKRLLQVRIDPKRHVITEAK